jgi:hypothetical protein
MKDLPEMTLTVRVKWNYSLSYSTRTFLIRYGKLTKEQIEMLWSHMHPRQRLWCVKCQKVTKTFVEKHWNDFWPTGESDLRYYEIGDREYLLRTNRVSSSFVIREWNRFGNRGKVVSLTHIQLPKQFVLQNWELLKDISEQVKCWGVQELSSRLEEKEFPMFLTCNNDKVRRSAKRAVRRFEVKKQAEGKS